MFCQDEARIGQKGRTGHSWYLKGQRPTGPCDQGFDWTYLFAVVEPATGAAFALVLPTVSTAAMTLFLDQFAQTLEPDDHVVMVLDGAGWHGSKGLVVPPNLTLLPLPPYSPECNPVERLWLYLRERFFSCQVWLDQDAIVQACCDAWNLIANDLERLKSLTLYPWIKEVIS